MNHRHDCHLYENEGKGEGHHHDHANKSAVPSMCNILTLPNEILTQILSYLPSPQLVRLATVSRRVHLVILHILRLRINFDDEFLVFECYPPSEETTTRFLQCEYLGTWMIDKPLPPAPLREAPQLQASEQSQDETEVEKKIVHDIDTTKIVSLYSHFFPIRSHTLASFEQDPLLKTLASKLLSLEENSLFATLCAQAYLIKPDAGCFFTAVEIFKEKDEVRREWLKQAEQATSSSFPGELVGVRDTAPVEGEKGTSDPAFSRILWFGKDDVAGLKFRVREMKLNNQVAPVLVEAGEDPAATYNLYYEALLIKTIHLVAAFERSS